jgi:hypothetical protein
MAANSKLRFYKAVCSFSNFVAVLMVFIDTPVYNARQLRGL